MNSGRETGDAARRRSPSYLALAVVIAAAAALVLLGVVIGRLTSPEGTTTATVSPPPAVSPSTEVPPTTTPPPTYKFSETPEDAALGLLRAWQAGDRKLALSYATTPSVVNELFALGNADAWRLDSCTQYNRLHEARCLIVEGDGQFVHGVRLGVQTPPGGPSTVYSVRRLKSM
jgi:hypothetical protein